MSDTNTKNITQRTPIVVVLGHVDHGKSTLLDYIRKSNTVDKESGGITQHVAAYEVEHKDESGKNKKITFLDTPGHEAFGAMRNRSAIVADIAILIVSAEDGVREQTKEALKTITDQKVPYVVAVNKIDKPGANIEKTLNSLTENGVYLEGRGGSIPYAQISAKTGEGIDTLLELVLLVAELEELTGDAGKPAEGFVIEAHRDPKKGISATLLITNGTIKHGMYVATAGSVAPTRIIENFAGIPTESAQCSSPVHIVGWSNPPTVGDMFASFKNKKEAEKYATETTTANTGQNSNEQNGEAENENTIYIPLVIKTDVLGSIDAIEHEIDKLNQENVSLKVVRADVGTISETDIKSTGGDGNAIILGFHTKIDSGVEELAERDGIMVQTFDIIYKLAEWLEKEIEKRKPSEKEDTTSGVLSVLKIFSTTKKSQVIGGRVESGNVSVGDTVNILRRDEEIGTGKIKELQADKNAVQKVEEGTECGLKVETNTTIVRGDSLASVA